MTSHGPEGIGSRVVDPTPAPSVNHQMLIPILVSSPTDLPELNDRDSAYFDSDIESTPEITFLAPATICAVCAAYTILRCDRCLQTRYCSTSCQEFAWAQHRTVCRIRIVAHFLQGYTHITHWQANTSSFVFFASLRDTATRLRQEEFRTYPPPQIMIIKEDEVLSDDATTLYEAGLRNNDDITIVICPSAAN